MKNVLIVDNDFGFLFWLGEALVGPRYQPWPATDVHRAIAVGRKRVVPMDLLIVNPTIAGVSELISYFRRKYSGLKVIASAASSDAVIPGVDAWLEKLAPEDPAARQKWAQAVDQLMNARSAAA